jgi:plasmid rolling circle replication initiator protein Rep
VSQPGKVANGCLSASSLPPSASTVEGYGLPLADISERDKPWDKHRGNADRVETFYHSTSEFETYAQRVSLCSQLLEFKPAPGDEPGRSRLKLAASRFCRVRHCPVCQWRRSLMWKAKAYKVLPKAVEGYPEHRWLFVTLTVKNCPITDLRATLQAMNKAYQRMAQRKAWPADGWLRSTEVTRGRDGSSHPHFHCLLMVPPVYFSGKGYMKQADWVALWRSCLRLDYDPIMDVRAVKSWQNPTQLIPELLKYCTKESDLVADREWFLELNRQLHKTRAIATGGVLKEYLKELEQEPEDLIGEGLEPAEPEEDSFWFAWRQREKKYRLVD